MKSYESVQAMLDDLYPELAKEFRESPTERWLRLLETVLVRVRIFQDSKLLSMHLTTCAPRVDDWWLLQNEPMKVVAVEWCTLGGQLIADVHCE